MYIHFGGKLRVNQIAPQLWKLLSKDLRSLSAFRRSFKDYGRGGYIGVQPGVDTLNSIQVKFRFVNPSRRTVKKHLTKL